MAAMKRLLFAIAFLTLFACDPKEFEPKEHGPFNQISSNGFVKFEFVQGAYNHIVSTSMMDNFYNVSGGVLSINGNGTMTIAVSNTINPLWCNGCNLESDGPLTMDTLNVYMHSGGMKMKNFHVNNILQINAVNLGTYKLSGSAAFLNLTTVNLASFEGYGFVTDSTYINTTSITDLEVHATQVLNVFINSIGGVKYKGNPPIVRASITGMGRLKKVN